MRVLALATTLALTLGATAALAQSSATPPAEAWEIGPFIGNVNRSVGMPLNPTPTRTGWSFDFPYPNDMAGHVHYVTFRAGSLAGASRITMRYRIEARRGTQFIPLQDPTQPATVSLFFQRSGDRWSGKGRYAFYRWWGPTASLRPVAPGTYDVTVSLYDPDWISVWGGKAGDNARAFEDAIDNADSVGFVFGSSSLRGHGVYATGPARFTLLDYRIE